MLKYQWLFTYYWHLTCDMELYIIYEFGEEIPEKELNVRIKKWSKFFIAKTLLNS